MRNPGRFEVVQRDPLLILDGAHNPDGARAVVEALAEGFVVTGEHRLVIGVLDGREPASSSSRSSTRHRRPRSCAACPTRPGRSPPNGSPSTSARSVVAPASIPDVAGAVEAALAAADPDDVVLVTGSLYTVGGRTGRACRRLGLVTGSLTPA